LLLNLFSGAGDEPAVAGAVGKWESRALCGISKRSGKVTFTFPRSGFSTALFPADFRREFFRRPISQAAVRPRRIVIHSPRFDDLSRFR
jgi:hypothetical protein